MYSNHLEIYIVDTDVFSQGVFIFFKQLFLSPFANDTNFTVVPLVFFINKLPPLYIFWCNFSVLWKISINVIGTRYFFVNYTRRLTAPKYPLAFLGAMNCISGICCFNSLTLEIVKRGFLPTLKPAYGTLVL